MITSETLSELYGSPVEVLRTSDGRLVVVGQPEAPAPSLRPARASVNPHLSLNPSDGRTASSFVYPFMVNALEAGTIVAVLASVDRLVHGAAAPDVRRAHAVVDVLPRRERRRARRRVALARLLLLLRRRARCAIAAGSRTAGRRNLAQESAVIGTVQAAGLALGFLFLSLYGGILENLEALLFGSFLGITTTQVHTLAAITICVLVFFLSPAGRCSTASVDERAAARARRPRRGASRRVPRRARAGGRERPPRSPACCSSSRCSSLPPRQHSS